MRVCLCLALSCARVEIRPATMAHNNTGYDEHRRNQADGCFLITTREIQGPSGCSDWLLLCVLGVTRLDGWLLLCCNVLDVHLLDGPVELERYLVVVVKRHRRTQGNADVQAVVSCEQQWGGYRHLARSKYFAI